MSIQASISLGEFFYPYNCEKSLEEIYSIKKRVAQAHSCTSHKLESLGPVSLGLWWPNTSK